ARSDRRWCRAHRDAVAEDGPRTAGLRPLLSHVRGVRRPEPGRDVARRRRWGVSRLRGGVARLPRHGRLAGVRVLARADARLPRREGAALGAATRALVREL